MALDSKKLLHLFSTPIMEHWWEDSDELNKQLCSIILEKEKTSPGAKMSNVGGWHSEGDLEKWGGAPGQRPIERIGETVDRATLEYYTMFHGREPIRWRVTLWANVNRSNEYNKGHVHPGATWSGVYYVDAGSPDESRPGNGNLVLDHPNGAVAMSFFPEITPSSYIIKPRSSLMSCFPAICVMTFSPIGAMGQEFRSPST